MNDSVRDALKKLITQHGTDLCSNRQRLEGMLRDFCGEHKREVTVIVTAAREGVAEELLHVNGAQVDLLLVRRLIRRLHEEAAIDERAAAWAVESWATALGKVVPGEPVHEPPPLPPATITAPSAPRQDTSPAAPKSPPIQSTPPPPPRFVRYVQPPPRRRGGLLGVLGVEESPPAEPQPLEAKVAVKQTSSGAWMCANPVDNADLLWIPPGEFLMGSNEYDNERPPHKVYLDGYWVYKYPVTVAQYRKFCQATNRQMPNAPGWGWKDDHPIVSVTWNDAREYSQWAGVRLPTEAEWEKAARGTDGRKFPWGNDWDGSKCANSVGGNSLSSTKPVGGLPQGASPYGCLDMAGNVWEWCADWYGEKYYACSPSKNPTGPSSGGGRVLRGGSWSVSVSACSRGVFYFRCSNRRGDYPGDRYYYFGFRCLQGPL